jgi:SecD/SecF fusion protein
MKNRKPAYIGLIILSALFLGFFDLPTETQKNLIPFAPDFITDNKIHLGLDLQGGAQLDYSIDLRNVPTEQKDNIVDGILNVINKRVNSLGVSEPNIYTSDIGDEKHIIVELAGIRDLDKAKDIVGKTIQLEFKELKSPEEQKDEDVEKEVKNQAQNLVAKVKEGGDLAVLGKQEQLSTPERVFYREVNEFKYKNEVNSNLADKLFELEAGQTSELIENSGSYSVDASGNFVPDPKTLHIVKVTEKQEVAARKTVNVSHILIQYTGVQGADSTITRTEEEAKQIAQEAITKINGGADFAEIAKEYSNDASNKETGGKLSEPVIEGTEFYVKEFSQAALNLERENQISPPIKSPFGFHIIKAEKVVTKETSKEQQVKYVEVAFSAAADPWKATSLNGQHFVRADVEYTPTLQPYVSIKFNDEGARLFEEITKRNVGKPLAIFVGGQIISAPNVNEAIAGGNAQISGQFTIDDANTLARDLNTGAIPAPIVLTGQYTIGATLGSEALNSSLYAGFLGLLLLAVFMILFYRLPGIIAAIALLIYTALLIFLIKVSLPIAWALMISLGIFIYLVYRIMQNRESGVEKAISGILITFVLFFITFILATPIVLTLAGIAGVILSIGMAVDANILIFERIKEELRDGRPLGAAIEVGFDRAWNSIRDSNFSSLITSAILFYFGSSIIQGFAFNLAAGILISMFSAITITKTFLLAFAGTRIGKNLWLFNSSKKKEKKEIRIIHNRKKFYWISIVLITVTIIGIPFFGIRLGLDFTGGTLMELQFENKEITVEQIRNTLVESEESVNSAISPDEVDPVASEEKPEEELASPANNAVIESNITPVDLKKNQIVPTETGFIIKIPHISNIQHDELTKQLKAKLGEFEETRFSTVGPTVGQSLQSRAIFAVLLASLMIVLYIALAFRKVPRYVGKWRFGLTAIAALVHDLAIMIGVYIFLGAFLNVEIDALFITAMLTVLGFSVHDTIVVFDRLREKLKYQKRHETFEDIANLAVNETLARSINTSISTLIVLLTMFLLGAGTIKFFILSLMVGILAGTYSSIFVATPLLVDWQNHIRNKKGN